MMTSVWKQEGQANKWGWWRDKNIAWGLIQWCQNIIFFISLLKYDFIVYDISWGCGWGSNINTSKIY